MAWGAWESAHSMINVNNADAGVGEGEEEKEAQRGNLENFGSGQQ